MPAADLRLTSDQEIRLANAFATEQAVVHRQRVGAEIQAERMPIAVGMNPRIRERLGEVAQWSRYSDAERERIMAELPSRRGLIRPEKLGLC